MWSRMEAPWIDTGAGLRQDSSNSSHHDNGGVGQNARASSSFSAAEVNLLSFHTQAHSRLSPTLLHPSRPTWKGTKEEAEPRAAGTLPTPCLPSRGLRGIVPTLRDQLTCKAPAQAASRMGHNVCVCVGGHLSQVQKSLSTSNSCRRHEQILHLRTCPRSLHSRPVPGPRGSRGKVP